MYLGANNQTGGGQGYICLRRTGRLIQQLSSHACHRQHIHRSAGYRFRNKVQVNYPDGMIQGFVAGNAYTAGVSKCNLIRRAEGSKVEKLEGLRCLLDAHIGISSVSAPPLVTFSPRVFRCVHRSQ